MPDSIEHSYQLVRRWKDVDGHQIAELVLQKLVRHYRHDFGHYWRWEDIPTVDEHPQDEKR